MVNLSKRVSVKFVPVWVVIQNIQWSVKTRTTNQAPLERNWMSTVCIPYVPKKCRSHQKNALSSIHFYKHVEEAVKMSNFCKLSYKDCTTVYIGETSRSVADRMKEHSRLTKRHTKNNEDCTKLECSSAIALHVLETEHHVDFDNRRTFKFGLRVHLALRRKMRKPPIARIPAI